MPKLLCLLVITAVALLSVKADDESRIIGGQDAVNGQFPHHVQIRNLKEDFDGIQCGGSIIGDRFVITNSWCFSESDDEIQNLRVIAGDVDIRTNATQHLVDKIIVHPHSSYSRNNIAVVHVTQPFKFSANVRAIQLPTADLPIDNDGVELPAVFIGWRKIEVDGKRIIGRTLQWLKTTVISNIECRRSWGSLIWDINNTCSKHQAGTGLCAPIAVGGLITQGAQPVLIGLLTSRGGGCPSLKPDVHIRVFPNLAFIRLAMKL